MYTDSHCHLNFAAFDKDLDEVLVKAKKAQVAKIIIPGAKIDSSKKAVEIAKSYKNCFAAVGIHPHHVDEYISLGVHTTKKELNYLILEKKVVAIGETGLDYYQYKGFPQISDEVKKRQKELLMLHIELAVKFNLPIIFHCRNAHDDMLPLLQKINKKNKMLLSGVFHCFDGDINHLKQVLAMGFFIGFDGNITYAENQRLRDLVKRVPLERLLLETDSPYLAPMPFRKKCNEPSNIPYIAQTIAGIHKKTISQIAEITSDNAIHLFKLGYL